MRLSYVIQAAVALFVFAGCGSNELNNLAREKEWMGDSSFAEGQIDDAIAAWESSLSFKHNVAVYEKLVSGLILKQDFLRAEEISMQGLTYFPNHATLFFNFALVKYYKREFEDAFELLDEALRLNSYYPNAHYLKGVMYENKGNFDMAKKEFVNEININPGSGQAWQKIKELSNEKK